jgi:hypothetical protein
MDNYEKFEQLLVQHSFKELSPEEMMVARSFINSEEEYESLRLTHEKLNSYFSKQTKISSNPETWRKIKSTWKESSMPVHRYHWIKTPMPAYATLLLVVSVGLVGWYSGSRFSSPKIHVQQVKSQVDTVFIASKPDTVVQERIIYLKSESQATPSLGVASRMVSDHPTTKGVSMKEKEELERLLVSGSM